KLVAAALARFGSWRRAIREPGFDYDLVCKRRHWTPERVVILLKQLHREGANHTHRTAAAWDKVRFRLADNSLTRPGRDRHKVSVAYRLAGWAGMPCPITARSGSGIGAPSPRPPPARTGSHAVPPSGPAASGPVAGRAGSRGPRGAPASASA